MNLKERLVILKETDTSKESILYNEIDNVLNMFDDMQFVKDIVKTLIKAKKNIIFICNKSCDKFLISKYFEYLADENVNILIGSLPHSYASQDMITILPDSEIIDVVKIFECIISGSNPFICGLNFETCENILEKTKALINLNFKNLTETSINTLIGYSDLYFICFEQQSNAKLSIINIKKINYNNSVLSEEEIFSLKNISYSENSQKDIIETDYIEDKNSVNKDEKDESLSSVKVNKYKLLKEKVRSKHSKKE